MIAGIAWEKILLRLFVVVALTALIAGVATVAPAQEDEDDYPHGNYDEDCFLCHGDESWAPLDLSEEFNHADFGFARDGAHEGVSCKVCHEDLDFTTQESSCAACHEDVHRSEFGADCSRCHTTTTFVRRAGEVRFHRTTRFPLAGAHVTLDCQDCHQVSPAAAPVYVGTPTECEACHLGDYQQTASPDHEASGFSTDCVACHAELAWEDARFDHAKTDFPLTGPHRSLDCSACHSDGNGGVGGKVECISCHREDFEQADSPHHVQLGFPEDCMQCHQGDHWTPAEFDHSTSDFPLSGAHLGLTCVACHSDGVYDGKPTDCYSCHASEYDNTTDPHHENAEFSKDCTQCHSTSTWDGAVYDHAGTDFPLTGSHIGLGCEECHSDGVYDGKPSDCYSCHEEEYRNTEDPNHQQAGFATDCTECHNTGTWDDASFDHAGTDFPLEGSHTGLDCAACHADGVYDGKPTDCYSCHEQDYNNTTEPDHQAAGYPTDCTECHNTNAWEDADYDHDTSDFPLDGAHVGLECSACHADGVYDGKPTDCYSCHADNYNNTTDPHHEAAGFATDCTECHTISAWEGATYDHAQTDFPLTGSHVGLPCSECHFDGVYDGKPTDCYSCHSDAYNNTTEPHHEAAGFGTDCTECHTTTSWEGATYDHDQTNFPLTGSHVGLPCSECHADGVYNGKPTDCYSCHKADYDNSTDPNHQAAGFPTDCVACHNTNDWGDADFEHDAQYFPIYSGKHKEKWDRCSDCHFNPDNYSQFSCIDCHEHEKSKMDDKHKDVTGYTYDSQACYQCHPDGRKE